MRSSTAPRTFESIAAPLDVARNAGLALLARSRFVRAILVDRDRRIMWQATAGVVVTFTVVAFAPLYLFLLGPLLFGVAHVAADVRYLVLRRGWPRPWLLCIAGFSLALVASGAVVDALAGTGEPGANPSRALALFVESIIAGAWIACAAVLGCRAGGSYRRLLWIGPALAVAFALAAAFPRESRAALAFGHNGVALALWLLCFRRHRRHAGLPLIAIGLALAVILSGATLTPAAAVGGDHWLGEQLATAAPYLTLGAATEWSARLVVLFVFLQSIHYAAWLSWIPQDAAPAPGTRSYRRKLRDLRHEFRTIGLVVVLTALIGLWVWAARDAFAARESFLRLANFHAVLELAVIVYLIASRSGATLFPARHDGAS